MDKTHVNIKIMNFPQNLTVWETFFVYLFFFWSLFWKGIALWRASKNNQKNWFIALLVLNTIGILDIIYLFRFSKKRLTLMDIKKGFEDTFFTKTKS